MEKTTFGIIVNLAFGLLSGISGLILLFAADIPSLYGAALNILGSMDVSNWGMLNGSCCICIPIPLVIFGFFAMHQRAKTSLIEELLSPSSSDNQ